MAGCWFILTVVHCWTVACVAILRSTVAMVRRFLQAWRTGYAMASTTFLTPNGPGLHKMVSSWFCSVRILLHFFCQMLCSHFYVSDYHLCFPGKVNEIFSRSDHFCKVHILACTGAGIRNFCRGNLLHSICNISQWSRSETQMLDMLFHCLLLTITWYIA